MILYFLSIAYLLIALFLYFEFTIYKTKKLFKILTENHFRPACIVNNNKKIIWKNNSFINQFAKIVPNNDFEALNPNIFFDKINIEVNGQMWFIEDFDLGGAINGIIFNPTEKIDPYTFLNLPFAIIILDEKNKIKKMNSTFEDLILIDHYKKDPRLLQLILEKSKSSSDLAWYTKEGLQPIKTSVKTLNKETVIFLENNLDNIKLKRKVQESQHLQILGQLTSSIIHDFKNLLTSICLITNSLSEELPNGPSLENMKQNIEKSENLLKELLNFIKSEPVENEIIEPKVTLEKMSLFIPNLLGSKIKLQKNITTDGYIKISETQLERILFNMVVNSKDAMPNGGIFQINTRKETFSYPYEYLPNKQLPSGQYYIIEVSDNGKGIPADCTDKMFMQFFTTKEKGTGIGLHSSLSIAEHCGGGITFSSSPNGTTFFIIMPLIKEYKKPEFNIDSNLKDRTNKDKKLIIVEDEEMIKNIIKKTFIQEGFKVIDFDNGTDALKEIKKSNFDYLITDAVLPGVDGTELANIAYKLKPDAQIFLASGYDFETLKINLTKELAEKIVYIGKPFTIKTLKETVLNKTLDKK